jgi:hypothetical protein
MKFERVACGEVDWATLDAYADRRVSQRRGWLEFLRASHRGEIVVARLDDSGETLGYFTGLIIRRFGVRIMGSPFPGWMTPHLGFNLLPGVSRVDAVRALLPFVFRDLGCLHLELADPVLSSADVAPFGFETHVGTTFVSDLTADDDVRMARLKKNTRNAVRYAERHGLTVEEATPDGFADEYYQHLTDVFARQGLRPTYEQSRVEQLIEHVHPTGDLLLFRVRTAEGLSIATVIFAGYGHNSTVWGGGSLRAHHHLRPNELLHWTAMGAWKARGVHSHDWGGGGDYKAKYGGMRMDTLHFRISRLAAIAFARELARNAHSASRRIRQLRRSG